jgi:hypothetical protein
MGLRSAGGVGFDSFLKLVGFVFTAVGLLIIYAAFTSAGQLGEGGWLFTFIGFLLICGGSLLILARTT